MGRILLSREAENMARNYHLTTVQFERALDNAAKDDQRWPALRQQSWLIDHAFSDEGGVKLRLGAFDKCDAWSVRFWYPTLAETARTALIVPAPDLTRFKCTKI